MSQALNAHEILHKVARALPPGHLNDIIIVGSLAAAAQLIRGDAPELRTKDVDGMVAPNARVGIAAAEIATSLIDEGWEVRVDSTKYQHPADSTTPNDKVPVVRLQPPGQTGNDWFLELLGAPPALEPNVNGKTRYSERLKTPSSDFEIPSFAYLGFTQYEPIAHASGLRLASVATMALANLLHHPKIGLELMSEPIEGVSTKRSCKDLGRVIAMAHLSGLLAEDSVEEWPQLWRLAMDALNAPAVTRAKLDTINSGVADLLRSPEDIDQALHSINYGLLSQTPMSRETFGIAARRYLQDTQ